MIEKRKTCLSISNFLLKLKLESTKQNVQQMTGKAYQPPLRTAFSWRIPVPCGPDTGNVQDRECLLWATASDALYHGPLAMGSPIASITAWLFLAFSIALLRNVTKQNKISLRQRAAAKENHENPSIPFLRTFTYVSKRSMRTKVWFLILLKRIIRLNSFVSSITKHWSLTNIFKAQCKMQA